MPVYEYMCVEHGPFESIRPMAEFDRPCACPVCGQASPRVMLNGPRLALMEAGKRRAHETNERSAHEPKLSRNHGLAPGPKAGAPIRNSGVTAPDGSKAYPSKRPWMLSQ